MLESFAVFTLTGVLLYRANLSGAASVSSPAAADPIAAALSSLVRDAVIPSRTGAGGLPFASGAYTIKWLSAQDLIFAAVIATAMVSHASYADALLLSVRDAFVSRFVSPLCFAGKRLLPPSGSGAWSSASAASLAAAAGASAWACGDGEGGSGGPPSIAVSLAAMDSIFNDLLDRAEAAHTASARGAARHVPLPPPSPVRATAAAVAAAPEDAGASAPSTPLPSTSSTTPLAAAPLTGLAALKARGIAPGGSRGQPQAGGGASGSKKGGGDANASAASGGGSGSKRTWDDPASYRFDEKKAAALDRSRDKPAEGGGEGTPLPPRIVFDGTSGSGRDLGDDGRPSAAASSVLPVWMSRASTSFSHWLSGVTGSRVLSEEDLAPIIDALRLQLVAQNVAEEVASELVTNVARQLQGTQLEGGATLAPGARLHGAVEDALRVAIERILTPRAPVDILRDAQAKRAVQVGAGLPVGKREPLVVVFCGVNGVGKSTSLSKVAFHLKDHGISVMMAACDSFRAGAVEQLKKHCSALDMPLYAQGYNKDPVAIAAAAIKHAKETGVEVVLVDTAGRMQNNAPLMAQLAKLVALNDPDLVLFTGEALVGGDGVDQLVEFDRALVDHAVDGKRPRRIDGIMLTKFDTVDDKVGAALSMVFRTGVPIAFVGVGQHYPDLRKLNVGAVLRSLLQ